MLSSHPPIRTLGDSPRSRLKFHVSRSIASPSAHSLSSIYYPLSSFSPPDRIPLPRDLFGTQTGPKKDINGTPFPNNFLAHPFHNPRPTFILQKTASRPLSRFFFSHSAHPTTNNQQPTTDQPGTKPPEKNKPTERTQIPLHHPKIATPGPALPRFFDGTSPPPPPPLPGTIPAFTRFTFHVFTFSHSTDILSHHRVAVRTYFRTFATLSSPSRNPPGFAWIL